MFFVFLSLVEFAAVNSYMREAEKYERLASYSAKKETTTTNDDGNGNPWIYSDDDDSSSASRSPILRSQHKNSKNKCAKTPEFNGDNDQNNNNNENEMAIGAKLHNWTNHAIAIPSLFGRCAGDNKHHGQQHHQNHRRNSHQQQNGPMRLMRHPSILAERILTVEHFEQLAEKRMSNSSQGKAAAAAKENHHHCLMQTSPNVETELRSIDADESDSLMMSPPAPQRKRVISPLAKNSALPPLRAPSPQAKQPLHLATTVSTKSRTNNNNNSEEGSRAATPTARKHTVPVPTIQPWPPSPMAQQQGAKVPPAAPRRKDQNEAKEAGHLMATNHFLREGFRYSRKGLFIDKWSRLLFPLAFALWNTYYWTYYLWFIQRHPSGTSSGE
uniref:Neur_chan_memb domain-containing protein n=1 Tax=Globodera pallida TaxID=36090 RepID=A0A183C1M6_GLOPA